MKNEKRKLKKGCIVWSCIFGRTIGPFTVSKDEHNGWVHVDEMDKSLRSNDVFISETFALLRCYNFYQSRIDGCKIELQKIGNRINDLSVEDRKAFSKLIQGD